MSNARGVHHSDETCAGGAVIVEGEGSPHHRAIVHGSEMEGVQWTEAVLAHQLKPGTDHATSDYHLMVAGTTINRYPVTDTIRKGICTQDTNRLVNYTSVTVNRVPACTHTGSNENTCKQLN